MGNSRPHICRTYRDAGNTVDLGGTLQIQTTARRTVANIQTLSYMNIIVFSLFLGCRGKARLISNAINYLRRPQNSKWVLPGVTD